MDSEVCREQLRRLKDLYGAPKTEQEKTQYDALIVELERRFLRLKDDEWRRTIDYVAEKKKTKGHPMLSDFIGAVAALRHLGRIAVAPSCDGCNGTGFIRRDYLRQESQERVSGVVPCPGCRSIDYASWGLKEGLSAIAVEDVDPLVRQARSMKPSSARVAFEFIERYRFLSEVPERILTALVARASEDDSL